MKLASWGKVQPAIFAPGQDILSLRCRAGCPLLPVGEYGTDYGTLTGSSQATGFVAGAVAWMRAATPENFVSSAVAFKGENLKIEDALFYHFSPIGKIPSPLSASNNNLLPANGWRPFSDTLLHITADPQSNWSLLGNNLRIIEPSLSTSGGNSAQPVSIAVHNSVPYAAWAETVSTDVLFSSDLFVKRWNGSAWEAVGGQLSSGDQAIIYDVSIIIVNEIPYVGWSEQNRLTFKNESYVKHWDGTAWVSDGMPGSDIQSISNLASNGNQVFVSIGKNGNIQVFKLNGNSWELVGTTVGVGVTPYLAVLGQDPIVTFSEIVPVTSSSSRAIVHVKKWDGVDAWIPLGGDINMDMQRYAANPRIKVMGDVPYVIWAEYRTNSVSIGSIFVKKWENDSWVAVGTEVTNNGTQFSPFEFDLAFKNATPYVAYAFFDGVSVPLRLKNWNGNAWISQGMFSGVGFTGCSSGTRSLSLVASDLNLFLMWQENGIWGQPTFVASDSFSPGINGGSGCPQMVKEGKSAASYGLSLRTKPSHDVKITVIPDGQLLVNGSNNPVQFTFTSINWNVTQTVHIIPIDDSADEGWHSGTIKHSVVSNDPAYAALSVLDIFFSIEDNDGPAIITNPSNNSLKVTEGGLPNLYTLRLNNIPQNPVKIIITPDNQVTVNNSAIPIEIVFDSNNWNEPQAIEVHGLIDDISEGLHRGTIRHTVQSTDPVYAAIRIPDVLINIFEAGISLTQSNNSTDVSEGGSADFYSIKLNSEPTFPVSISIIPDSQLTVNGSKNPIVVTFDKNNWNSSNNISIRAILDTAVEGEHSGTITHSVTSSDSLYNGMIIAPLIVNIREAGVTLQQSTNPIVLREGGSSETYSIKLNTQPSFPVKILVLPDNQVTVNSSAYAEFIFDASNWNSERTIAVSAIADSNPEGNHTSAIVHIIQSSDTAYSAVLIPTLLVQITEINEAEFLLAKQNLQSAQQSSQQAITSATAAENTQSAASTTSQSINTSLSQIQTSLQSSQEIKNSVNIATVQNLTSQTEVISQQRLALEAHQQHLEQIAQIERLRNALPCGSLSCNPVRLATGLKENTETDLSIPFGDEAFRIGRKYSVNNQNNFSFGRGWFFNYDSRIIRGTSGTASVKAQTQAVLTLAQSTLATVTDLQSTLSAGQNSLPSIYTHATEQYQALTTALNTLTQLHAEVLILVQQTQTYKNETALFGNEAIHHANIAGGAEAAQVIADAQSAIALAENALQRAQTAANGVLISLNNGTVSQLTAQSYLGEMQAIQTDLNLIAAQLQALVATLTQHVTELTFGLSVIEADALKDTENIRKNLSVVDPEFLQEQQFGNNYIKWIDEDGNGRIFKINADLTTEPFDKANTPAQNKVTLTLKSDGYTVRRVDGMTYDYNVDGLLIRKKDRNGLTLNFHYATENAYTDDGAGGYNVHFKYTLHYIEDTFGRKTFFTHQNGHIATITDPTGRVFRYEYNAEKILVKAFDPAEQAITYGYENLALNKLIDRKGAVREYQYEIIDGLPRVVREKDPLGNEVRFVYDFHASTGLSNHASTGSMGSTQAGSPQAGLRTGTTAMTDRRGFTSTFYHNERGSTLSTQLPGGASRTFTYDERQNPITSTDENGNVTQYEYTVDNQVAKIIAANGTSQQFSYDRHGLLLSATDAKGNTTTYVRDTRGNLTEVRLPDGGVIRSEYNSQGLRIKETDANGNNTTFVYDSFGYLKSSTAPNGAITEYEFDALGRIHAVKNPDGGVITAIYDNLDRIITSFDPLGRKTEFNYSATGELLQRVLHSTGGGQNRVYTFSYNAAGRMVSVAEPGGLSATMSYDEEENLISTKINNTLEFIRRYDARGRVIEIKQPDTDIVSGIQYDKVSNVISVTDALGNQTIRSYDALNRLIEETNAIGAKTKITYDANGQVLKVTDPLNRETTLQRDAVGRVTKAINALNEATETMYDRAGNPVEVKDPAGRTTKLVYNELQRVTQQIDALGQITHFAYDLKGRLVRSMAPNGAQTTLNYDALDRIISLTDAAGNVARQEYDEFGNLAKAINQNGEILQYTYDIRNRLTKLTDSLGNSTTYEYDSFDRMVGVTNAMDETTRHSYDLIGRLIKVTSPMGHEQKFEYDKLQRQTARIDAMNRRTEFTYDAVGRMTKVKDALGKITAYQWGLTNTLEKTIDAKGNATHFEYDALQRLIAKTNALGHKTHYNYDVAGNMVERIWADGAKTKYAYDELNRLVQRSYFQTSSSTSERVDDYAYDEVGNLLRAANENAVETYEYDILSRMTSVTNWTLGKSFNYEYDKVGRRTKMTLPKTPEENDLTQYHQHGQHIRHAHHRHAKSVIKGFMHHLYHWRKHFDHEAEKLATEYIYDAAGRMTKIDGPSFTQANTHYEYDKVGRRIKKKLPNGITTNYAYDTDGRLTQIRDKSPYGQDLLRFDYKYDDVGNILSRERENGKTEVMNYDNLDRMVSHKKGNELSEYVYDAAGNRTHENKNGRLTTASFNELNQITSRSSQYGQAAYPAVSLSNPSMTETASGTTNYEYDLRGNRNKKASGSATTNYQYNIENQLVGVELPAMENHSYRADREFHSSRGHDSDGDFHSNREKSSQVGYKFAFDALDRRVSKQFTSGRNTTTTLTGYDGRQGLYEVTSDLRPQALYNYKPGDRSPYGELIDKRTFPAANREQNGHLSNKGSQHYFHQDGLGSTLVMTDTKSKVDFSYNYDAWGNLTQSGDTQRAHDNDDRRDKRDDDASDDNNSFLFTEKEFDSAANLYHMDARAYDPETGSFLQSDPFNIATSQLPAPAQGIAAMAMGYEMQMLTNPHQFMSYGYVGMNPLRYNDPNGLIFGAIGNFFGNVGRGIQQGFNSFAATLQNTLTFKATKIAADLLFTGTKNLVTNVFNSKSPAWERVTAAVLAPVAAVATIAAPTVIAGIGLGVGEAATVLSLGYVRGPITESIVGLGKGFAQGFTEAERIRLEMEKENRIQTQIELILKTMTPEQKMVYKREHGAKELLETGANVAKNYILRQLYIQGEERKSQEFEDYMRKEVERKVREKIETGKICE